MRKMAQKDWKREGNTWYKKNSDTYIRLDHNNRLIDSKLRKVYEVFLWNNQYSKGFVGGFYKTKREAIQYIKLLMR
jgi:hypothetical protein